MVEPVPLPSPEATDLGPPGLEQVQLIVGAIETAAVADEGETELQRMVMTAQCEAMTGFPIDEARIGHVSAAQLAQGLARRNWIFRTRVFQEILLVAMLRDPPAPEVGRRIKECAHALGLGDEIEAQIERFGPEAYDAAIADFARNGYSWDFISRPRPMLHTDRDIGDGWGVVEALLSPWLDLSMADDAYDTVDDPTASCESLAMYLDAYLGHHDPADPVASPLYADLAGLPPLLVQVGTGEVFVGEARVFAERAAAAGVDVTLDVAQGMPHIWHLFTSFVPEAGAAIERVGRFAVDHTA